MRRALANIFRLGIKELRSLRADPVLVVLIIYSFTYAIYAVATGVRFEVDNAAVAIVDEDRSALSRRIAAALLPPYFRPAVEIAADRIDALMDAGQYVFVLEIPPRFESDLLAGRSTAVQINVDATAMALAGNGTAYIQNIVTREVGRYLGRDAPPAAPAVDLVVRAMFNPNLESAWFTSVMQIVNNITLLSVILAGAALIREREHGTVEHLLVMPVRPTEIMLAKLWANGLVIVAAAMASLGLVVHGLLDVPLGGSVALFLAGTMLYQVAVTAIGILLATVAGSMPQFGLLSLPVLIMMNLLSGGSTPLESMPVALQKIMLLSPSTHFVAFAQAVLYRGADFSIVWPDLLAVAAISAVCFAVALARFRRTIVTTQ
jgi:ABC-2 type transport system permease protein